MVRAIAFLVRAIVETHHVKSCKGAMRIYTPVQYQFGQRTSMKLFTDFRAVRHVAPGCGNANPLSAAGSATRPRCKFFSQWQMQWTSLVHFRRENGNGSKT